MKNAIKTVVLTSSLFALMVTMAQAVPDQYVTVAASVPEIDLIEAGAPGSVTYTITQIANTNPLPTGEELWVFDKTPAPPILGPWLPDATDFATGALTAVQQNGQNAQPYANKFNNAPGFNLANGPVALTWTFTPDKDDPKGDDDGSALFAPDLSGYLYGGYGGPLQVLGPTSDYPHIAKMPFAPATVVVVYDTPGPPRVPEPATLSLLALGGLAMLRRRRG